MIAEVKEEVKALRIETTDVILIEYGKGRGKIIISDGEWDINASYYWGSMGECDLKTFLLTLDSGYFVGKLGIYGEGDINMQKTMANVRKSIKQDFCFHWYMDLEYNKILREELNTIQNETYDARHFVDLMEDLKGNYQLEVPKSHKYHYEINSVLNGLSSEPWDYIVNEPHKTNLWLKKFLPKLKKRLKTLG